MSKVVEFKIMPPSGEKLIDHYRLSYNNITELNNTIQEAREVWYDCRVEIITDSFIQTFLHTYHEESLMNNK